MSKQLRVSLEALRSKRLYKVMSLLENVEGFPIINRPTTGGEKRSCPQFLRQLADVADVADGHNNKTDIRFYYNLYGLKALEYSYLFSGNESNNEQLAEGLELVHQHLFKPPDYIIYLHGNPDTLYHEETSQGLTLEQYKEFYTQYEYFLDNSHCPFPVFKVNLEESIENVALTLKAIFRQIQIEHR